MSYSKEWRGRCKRQTASYQEWSTWFNHRYYAMRFWYRLTGCVPDRIYIPPRSEYLLHYPHY